MLCFTFFHFLYPFETLTLYGQLHDLSKYYLYIEAVMYIYKTFAEDFTFYTILPLLKGKGNFSLHTIHIVNCKGPLIYLHKISSNSPQ